MTVLCLYHLEPWHCGYFNELHLSRVCALPKYYTDSFAALGTIMVPKLKYQIANIWDLIIFVLEGTSEGIESIYLLLIMASKTLRTEKQTPDRGPHPQWSWVPFKPLEEHSFYLYTHIWRYTYACYILTYVFYDFYLIHGYIIQAFFFFMTFFPKKLL